MYTNLLSVLNLLCSWNLFLFLRIPLIPWKLTSSEHWINLLFVSLMTYLALGYIFVLDVSIFTTIDDEKEVKINSSSILKDFT